MSVLDNELLLQAFPFILVALVGGVIGAFFYALITPYFNYKPAVAQRIDVLPKFEALSGLSELRSQLMVSNGTTSYPYTHLYTVRIELTNESTLSFDQFEFGITLEANAAIVYIEDQPPDRHRLVKVLTQLDFEHPPGQLDVMLQPFNQTDTYKFHLLVFSPEQSLSSSMVALSSSEAIRFVKLPGTEELLKKAAKSIALPLGPFKLSFR